MRRATASWACLHGICGRGKSGGAGGTQLTTGPRQALTRRAADRRYKKAKKLSEALAIMGAMKRGHHVDPDLFDLFLTSGVFRRYAERFLQPEQIDDVDVGPFLGPVPAHVAGG
jgi:hypothetical protein